MIKDDQFFSDHPDRQTHIRPPGTQIVRNSQRATHFRDECEGEFWSLGAHDKTRRRILLWKVPKNNPYYDPRNPQILKIPFLAFADETIEDRDDILLPILQQIMKDALKGAKV